MSNTYSTSKKQGFTLIEILVVIGIIAILAAIVIIAINPARQFALARNSQRTSNVSTILNALGQNMADNKGILSATCPTIPSVSGTLPTLTATLGGEIGNATGQVDLRGCLVTKYISEMPVDPTVGASWDGTNYHTGYRVVMDGGSRITVFAPDVESALGNTIIGITR